MKKHLKRLEQHSKKLISWLRELRKKKTSTKRPQLMLHSLLPLNKLLRYYLIPGIYQVLQYIYTLKVQTKFELLSEGVYVLTLEVKVPLETLILHADVPIEVEEYDKSQCLISRFAFTYLFVFILFVLIYLFIYLFTELKQILMKVLIYQQLVK